MRASILARLVLSVPMAFLIWWGAGVLGHPVPWWVAAIAALVVMFIGELILPDD